MNTIYLCLCVFVLFFTSAINVSFAKDTCLEIPKNNLKEFKEMGVSKIGLFIYPGDNSSRIVAIGR
jgi:hypothetical protein